MWIILFCGTVINGGTRIVRCEVLTVVVVKTAVFLDVVPCSAVYINHIKSHHIPEGGSFQYKTSLFVHVISSQKRFIFTLIPIFKHYCYIMNMSLIFTNCYQVCLCVRARVYTFLLVYNTIVHHISSVSYKNISNNSGRLTKFFECGKNEQNYFFNCIGQKAN